jgi:hypothetical protein
MVSAHDGWILGQDDFFAGVGTFLLRFHDGGWVREPFPFQGPSPSIPFWPLSMAMVSATEGWVGGTLHDTTYAQPDVAAIFHDASGTWRQETLPAGLTSIPALSMLGPDTGWALGQTSSGNTQSSQILRYRGGQWTTEAVFPGASLTTISMASATDGWAAGGNLLLRYANGAWSPVTLPLGFGIVSRSYTSVSMVSATAGWAAALDQWPDGTCSECGGGGSRLVLLRYVDGAWQEWPSAGPIPTAGGNGSGEAEDSTSVVAVSAAEVWVADGVVTHYTDGQSAEVLRSNCGSLLVSIALVPTTHEAWVIGKQGQLLHYLNGTLVPYETGVPCSPGS